MAGPWFRRSPSLLTELRKEIEAKYPDLAVSVRGEVGLLRGSFPILHDGAELDRFQIEVFIPPDFPKRIPMVRETAGRIPHAPDWHTHEKGTLCVVVPEEWLVNAAAGSILAFLDGPLRNYFLNHALAEAGVGRSMGERSHGSDGLLEAYGELVEEKEPAVIKRYLDYVGKEQVKGHWECPCGSGMKMRKCHFSKVLHLRTRIPVWVAKSALQRLDSQMKREREGVVHK